MEDTNSIFGIAVGKDLFIAVWRKGKITATNNFESTYGHVSIVFGQT